MHNLRKAAEAVYLTQPAVTLAIAKLEEQVGAQLFERRSRGTFPTEAGELLLQRVDRMFDQIEGALDRLQISSPANTAASLAERITRPQARALAAIAPGAGAESGGKGITRASTFRAARELERTLGIALLTPASNGLSTTEVGRELARLLAIALQEVDSGINDIAAEDERQRGQLRIGAMPLSGSFVVGPVLNELTSRFPSAHFEIRTGDHGHLVRALLRGEIDLIVGLLREVADENVVQEPLVTLPYVVVARRNHPLSRRTTLTLADLEGYDWVAPNPGTARRITFEHLVAGLRHPPLANIQASSLSTVRLLVSGSDRLGLLTRFEFERDKGNGELVDLPIGPIEPAHALGIVHRADWVPSPLHRHFIESLRRQASLISGSLPVALSAPDCPGGVRREAHA